jgi:acyl carrier protein
MDNDFNKTKETVRHELANFLGIDSEDIEDDFSLTEDLHMKASDLTDFMEILTRMNFATNDVDLTEVETFTELVEELTSQQ